MNQEASSKSTAQLLGDRRNKLKRLRTEFDLDPYGQRTDGLIDLAEAEARYDAAADENHKAAAKEEVEAQNYADPRPIAAVAGRIVQHRVMGNLIFLSLRDHTGDLQVAVSKKAVGQPYFGLAKMAEYGDIAAAVGRLGKTNTGEITLWVEARGPGAQGSRGQGEDSAAEDSSHSTHQSLSPSTPLPFSILTKSLALPPNKFHGLTDPETRYRKRYVDLYANPHVMQTMQLRIRIIDQIRDYLRGKGFLEVETPMLQTLHGGANARPFRTHHNALDLPLTLRIAPELYLKRLLVGGLPKVFEINRNFRNEGISPRHNPEFTMLEAYQAYGNWETMADLVEDMTCTVAMNVLGTLKIEHGTNTPNESRPSGSGPASNDHPDPAENAKTPSRQDAKKTIDLTRPWRRVSLVNLVEEKTGFKFTKEPATDEQIDQLRQQNPGKELSFDGDPAEQLIDIYEKLIEPTLINPTFVTHIPSVIIPLAKKNADDPYFADVYELAINGVEISPGYTELNDPEVQEANFRAQVGDEDEKQQIDEDFLEALRVGMPPAGGLGLGIDRLVMMLTGAESIRDVIAFPLMRPAGDAGRG